MLCQKIIRSLLQQRPLIANMSRYAFAQATKDPKQLFNYAPLIKSEVMNLVPQNIENTVSYNITPKRVEYVEHNKKPKRVHASTKKDNWERDKRIMSQHEAVEEAQRCLKCADAPCQKGCSTNIDIKSFIYCIEQKNWYGAAKAILTNNPVGLSCGLLCPISELCASNCNLVTSDKGAIEINRLQEFAVRAFKEMGVPQIRDPSLPKNLPKSYDTPIALVGCGTASISCATFLGRMGYNNIQIFEKDLQGGGLVSQEIPENRSPLDGAQWEVELMQDLGVKVHYGKGFGSKPNEVNFDSLKKQGFEAVFMGIGLPKPQMNLGADIYSKKNVWHSKNFLRPVCESTKPGYQTPEKVTPPKLSGHAVVIGIGDTAIDCARSAYRSGAERVSVIFRRGFSDLRANDEEFQPAFYDGCNFIPYSIPEKINFKPDGSVESVTFKHHFPKSDNHKNPNYQKSQESMTLKCDHLITAFGSQIDQSNAWAQEICNSKGLVDVNSESNQHKKLPWLFSGGDAIGSKLLVDAVNDGKIAAWSIHKYIQNKNGIEVSKTPKLSAFHTPIDLVDLSISVAGVNFFNPFGLASAPPATTYPMIKRAFDEGWSFAVTKTFCLDKDTITNVSPRIYKSTADELRKEAAFANIELISEKTAAYWIQGAKDLKKNYPNHVLIGSIMCGFNKEDWQTLTKMCAEANFDLLELNLSCPHGMTEKGMGRACGENPEWVEQIARWVTEVTKTPVFIKITPNYGEAEKLAEAAKKGGATGVTLTNTMPSLMDPTPCGEPFNAVGEKKQTTYGGATGSLLRPFALKKCSEVASLHPDIEILGTGGIVSSDNAIAFIRYGAKVLQIASSVQNQDASTVVFDLITGTKAHLYLSSRQDLKKKGWSGQFLPIGFDKLKTTKESEQTLSKVPKLKEIVGANLAHLSPIHHMKNEIFVVPEFVDDLCVKCGRCYLTCADSGYQAIKFFGTTKVPEVTDDCTGCGLCLAVCPIPGALVYVPRKTEYTPSRGIAPGKDCPPDHLKTFPAKVSKASTK